MVIQGSSVFAFDRKQRATSNRNTTAWIRHFAKHMDKDVLPNLPGHFGTEYIHGSGQEQEDDGSLRVNHEMLYEIAGALGIWEDEPLQPMHQKIKLPLPLLPVLYDCPQCHLALRRPTGNIYRAWVIGPSNASRAPVFLGQCPHCRGYVFPDRFSQDIGVNGEEEVYNRDAPVISVGRGRYASRELAQMLSACVTTAHLPLSTFATCWNLSGQFVDENGEQLKLTHKHMWRLFTIHNCLHFSAPHEVYSIPSPPDDDEDDEDAGVSHNLVGLNRDEIMVKKALALWPSIPSGHYRTYHTRQTADHKCAKCAHFHRSFQPNEGGLNSTDAQLLNAHRRVQVDPTRVVTAGILDGIEKLGHKVSGP